MERIYETLKLKCGEILGILKDGFCAVDKMGKIMYVNEHYCRLSGYTEQELLNMYVWELEVNESCSEIKNKFNELLEGKELVFDTKHKRKDDSVFFVEISAKFVNFSKDFFFVVFIKNIESEKKYYNLFNEMITAVAIHEIICDKNGVPCDYKFLDVNPAFEKLTGLKKKEIIDKTVLEVLPGTEKIWIDKYGEVALTGKPISFQNESKILGKHYSVNAFSLKKNQFVVTFVDNTETYELQKQLIRSEKLSAVGQLAAGVAHEFNNILAINKLNAQLLLLEYSENPDIPNRQENINLLKNILSSVDRGKDIVSNMMSFAKPAELKSEKIDLLEVVEEVLKLQKEQIKLEHIILRKECSSTQKVEVDVGQIQQVFLNLILNARHAIKPKGKGEIFIKMYDQNDEVVVIFSDNGIGISDEIKNKIFTPFFSTKGAYSKDNLGLKGSGLGLSVSYKIIQQHDGKISFESFADKGTSFKIILPAVREIPLKKSLTNFINNSWKKDFRILIVDDEVVFIQTIKLLLNKLGYEKIGIANSGKDALNKFSQMKFDTVFLDMLLPDMDGYSILSELKKISDNTPVIFISGQVGLEEKQIEKKGIFGFIQKPFDIKEIDEFLIKIYNEQYKK